MNDAWGNDDSETQGGPKALRDAYEKQKARNDELEAKYLKLEGLVTRNAVADLIEGQGVSRAAAQYYNGDPDPEKVTSWVNDMRGAFGASIPNDAQPAEPVLNATDQEQYQRMMQAGSNGNPVGSNADSLGAALADAKSSTDMIAAFQKFGR